MSSTIKYRHLVWAAMFLLAGCTKDLTETERGGNQQTGKKVTVALQLHVPKPTAPVIKAQTRTAEEGFIVESDEVVEEYATRSDGATKLYNLWLFQFNADGSINGLPHKISDEVTAVNDMVLLDVPLIVAKDQTLYLLALGRQIDADLLSIRSFDQAEALSFDYTTTQGGVTKSRITTEDDMPFAGYVKGITVVEVNTGENRGQIEYNTPSGFTGGIGIRRLMSKITLRYKFEVSGYKIDGLRLINANSTIRITNPATNDDTDNYVTLEGTVSPLDADGFYSVTWFAAQNQQGEVDIRTESDRYYQQLENGKYIGTAPVRASHIEAWAYSINNPDFYSIYQMYVGKNNTSNFDVTANTLYNLRTTINTDVESAKNDGRVRSFTAKQSIFLSASGVVPGSYSGTVSNCSSAFDLDSHYSTRPLIIYAKGRIVSIGIYLDQNCTQLADPATSWLKLSSSKNYTDAYNNSTEPFATSIVSDIIQLPTKLQFYLYSDEYILDQQGEYAYDTSNKRRIYIRVETTTDGVTEGTIKRNSATFFYDQRPAIPIGRFGGKLENGQYAQELCCEDIQEYNISYGEDTGLQTSYLITGYYGTNINRNPLYSGVLDPSNGRLATIQLVENPGNLQVNLGSGSTTVNLANPIKRADGHVMLYQYEDYNSYPARYCYNKNRDKNGNGYLDDNEIEWYMPAVHQLLSASASFTSRISFSSSNAINYLYNNISSVTPNTGSFGYGNVGSSAVRCVRDVSKPKLAQTRFYVYEDARSNKYGAIDALDLYNSENREENPDFYVNVPLVTYTIDGNGSVPVTTPDGQQIYVKRMRRHGNYKSTTVETLNSRVSSHFLIASAYIDEDGNATDGLKSPTGTYPSRLTWANAMGYLATANSAGPEIEQSAVEKGCALYRGKDGQDEPGSWRMPTLREMLLMNIYIDSFNDACSGMGNSIPLYKPTSTAAYNPDQSYWTATENNQTTTTFAAQCAWCVNPFNPGYTYGNSSGNSGLSSYKMSKPHLVRCIRDLAPVK